jgi:hypothetical protein
MISGTWDGLLVKYLVGLCRSGLTRLWVGHGEIMARSRSLSLRR